MFMICCGIHVSAQVSFVSKESTHKSTSQPCKLFSIFATDAYRWRKIIFIFYSADCTITNFWDSPQQWEAGTVTVLTVQSVLVGDSTYQQYAESATPRFVDSGESICEYEYLCEFRVKISKVSAVVSGTSSEHKIEKFILLVCPFNKEFGLRNSTVESAMH